MIGETLENELDYFEDVDTQWTIEDRLTWLNGRRMQTL